MKRKSGFRASIFVAASIISAAFFSTAVAAAGRAPQAAQSSQAGGGWFQTGTGLGVTKARVGVPELAARSPAAQPLEKTFHDVLWADLEYCGVLDLVSPSFYPLQVPSQPSELKAEDWAAAPANASMVAYGNVTVDGTNLAVAGYLSDAHNPQAPLALQKIYRGAATDDDARKLAHQFADDIVGILSGGLPSVAQTQIAYVSTTSGNKRNLDHGL